MKRSMMLTHKFLTSAIGLGVLVQMFLAGIWHAGVVADPEAHVFLGLGLLAASLLALIAAAVGRLDKKVIGTTALLFVLILLQPILIELRRNGLPFLSAFHTLNAAFVGMVSGKVTMMSRLSTTAEADPAAPSLVAGD